MNRRKVVIIGGGFGGLTAARRLAKADVDITLVDRTNFHLFQPLLYQVATGGLSPADIASPIRYILRHQRNVHVVLDTVVDINAAEVTTTTATFPFDTLIVATGATHHYFGNDGWEQHAPGLKTIPDATRIRSMVLEAFEHAERSGDYQNSLTFVVVGGGPTGVELAGAIAETAQHTLRKDFRAIDPTQARVLLVEAAPQILGHYPDPLPAKAVAQLEKLGVEVRLGWRVTDLDATSATLTDSVTTEVVTSACKIWAAGVRASPLGAVLRGLGADLDRAGRVMVEPDLSLPGHPEVFVIGDLAAVTNGSQMVPGVAPAAQQMGRFVADLIRNRPEPRPIFRYRDKGTLATIGRSAGVAEVWGLRLSGWPAWAAWLTIHIFFLIGFENRLLVLTQWTWTYITRNRSARLIVDYQDEAD